MIGRLRQGWRAILSFARPVDDAAAEALLSPALMRLFRRMRRSEQQHSLRVMAALRARGRDHPDLLVATLLHDCGKSRYPFSLPDRALAVLARKFLPGAYIRWSTGEPVGWRRAFVIAAQHPRWSAEDMAAAGASALAASLARRHQDKLQGDAISEEDRLLVALQAADEDN